jgi:DUF4097 and DUF4098 domain-containing protein YvlB
MSRPRSAGSFFWGLILIAAGSIFLLKNLGYDVPVWTGIARWWPALLIVWGVIKLIDYARLKRAGESGPLFGAGEVVLLIVVIMSGTALSAAANMSPDLAQFFEMADIDIFDVTGNSYHFTEHHELDVPSASSIEIFNRYGNVEVVPADTDRIVVDVDKTVIAQNEAEAAALSREFVVYSIVQNGSSFQVISNFNRDQNRVRGRRFKTSLVVKVPKRSAIAVDNRNGAVDVSGLTGDQRITNAFGQVKVSRITGSLAITNRNDTVTVEDIEGATTISNEFGNVEARRVTGELELRNRNGTVEVEAVKGDAKVTSAFGSINVKDIQGSLNVSARNTSVDVERVENDVVVDNQFQSVSLHGLKGGATVSNRNGSIDIRYDQPPRKDIRVNSQFGDVTLGLPAASAFSIDARTRFSNVSSDFSELTERNDHERNTITGQVGTGGPEIRIDNRNGSIHIEK